MLELFAQHGLRHRDPNVDAGRGRSKMSAKEFEYAVRGGLSGTKKDQPNPSAIRHGHHSARRVPPGPHTASLPWPSVVGKETTGRVTLERGFRLA